MMTIERGDLRVPFKTLEELAEGMLYLATVFTHDLDGFAARYEPAPEENEEERQRQKQLKAKVAHLRDWRPADGEL